MTWLFEFLAGVASLYAAYIHWQVTPDHMAESPAHGVFMLTTTVLQTISGALLIFLPHPPKWGLRAVFWGNLAITAVAVTAYTVGIPFSDGAEPLNPQVIQATAAEWIICLLVLSSLVIQQARVVRKV